jgi:hypothetical protein
VQTDVANSPVHFNLYIWVNQALFARFSHLTRVKIRFLPPRPKKITVTHLLLQSLHKTARKKKSWKSCREGLLLQQCIKESASGAPGGQDSLAPGGQPGTTCSAVAASHIPLSYSATVGMLYEYTRYR